MKWQREWSILTLFLVAALIKFFLFNLTRSLTMYFNVLRKPTFPPELYGCPVRLRYHTPFFLAVCGYHFWSPWQRWKHVCLVVRTSWKSELSTSLKRWNINLILTNWNKQNSWIVQWTGKAWIICYICFLNMSRQERFILYRKWFKKETSHGIIT